MNYLEWEKTEKRCENCHRIFCSGRRNVLNCRELLQ
jgi:hypothetical protein